jgi:hypothetical protein
MHICCMHACRTQSDESHAEAWQHHKFCESHFHMHNKCYRGMQQSSGSSCARLTVAPPVATDQRHANRPLGSANAKAPHLCGTLRHSRLPPQMNWATHGPKGWMNSNISMVALQLVLGGHTRNASVVWRQRLATCMMRVSQVFVKVLT